MQLEAVVTNVTAFGAFVDIGVHQDGLVHVSHLADEFVKNPRDVVRPGDKLKVWVLDVDLERRRIALSARREMSAQTTAESEDKRQKAPSKPRQTDPRKVPKQRGGKSAMGKTFSNNPFAGVFRR
ncbi:MAG: S1 RNA-binding domain-containing protein [Myxococcota bacterium]